MLRPKNPAAGPLACLAAVIAALCAASIAGAGSLTTAQQAVFEKLHYADFEAAKPGFGRCVTMDSFVSSGFTPTSRANFDEIAAEASGCIRELFTNRRSPKLTVFPREVLYMSCRRLASFRSGLPHVCRSASALVDPIAQ